MDRSRGESELRKRTPPFLLTLRADERKLARYWLDLGMYNFIFSPLDPARFLNRFSKRFCRQNGAP